MMLRIAILVLLAAVGGFIAWRKLRPPAWLVVPSRYKRLAKGHRSMREALELRGAMIGLAHKTTAADAQPLAGDIDALIEAIGDMCETQASLREQSAAVEHSSARARSLRNSVADLQSALREALDQLHELHMHLVQVTNAELDVAVADVRARLNERKRDLAFVLEAQREVEGLVDPENTD